MPLSIKCWQLSLSCFPREHILFSHNNISQSSFTVGVSMLQGHCHKRLKTWRVKYLSLKSIKQLSTTSGEISPITNKIMNLLFSSFKGIYDDINSQSSFLKSIYRLLISAPFTVNLEIKYWTAVVIIGFVFLQSGLTWWM